MPNTNTHIGGKFDVCKNGLLLLMLILDRIAGIPGKKGIQERQFIQNSRRKIP